jgi:hypothetical protein
MKTIGQDSRCSGRDSKGAPPEHTVNVKLILQKQDGRRGNGFTQLKIWPNDGALLNIFMELLVA